MRWDCFLFLMGLTSSVDASVDLHLWVRGDHAGPPGIGAHLGPHKIPNYKLLTEARLLDHWRMMNFRNLNMNTNKSLICWSAACLLQSTTTGAQRTQTVRSCLWRLWFSFDDGPLRFLCLGRRRFTQLGLDVGVVRLARYTCLRLARVQVLFLNLQLQPRTLFPLLLLPLMSALHLSGLILLRLLHKVRK